MRHINSNHTMWRWDY